MLRASSGPLPPVLPIVIYDGSERWTAAKDIAGLSATPGEHLAPYQPSQRYFLLDVHGYTDSLPEDRNRVAELIRKVAGDGKQQRARARRQREDAHDRQPFRRAQRR